MSDAATSTARSAIDPREVVDRLVAAGVTDFVSVPDWVQLSINRLIDQGYAPSIRSIYCATEDEAFAIAAGLHIGGRTSVVSIQNQGLYAGLNNLRALGLDAHIPLVMLVGQFGREQENLGQDPRRSRRIVVSRLEGLLDHMGIESFRLDGPSEYDVIDAAYTHANETSSPAAVIVGAVTSWVDVDTGSQGG